MNVVSTFLSYLLIYKYAALFVIICVSSIVPLPVTTLLMAVGAFSIQGYFDFSTSLIIATIANIVGDIFDYGIFRKFGHALLRDKYARKYPYFVRLEQYFVEHTTLCIFASRIIGILGPPVNFLAGYSKTSFWKFLFLDCIGNTIYVFLFLVIGYGVGDEWSSLSGLVSTVSGIACVLLLLWIIGSIYLKKKNK